MEFEQPQALPLCGAGNHGRSLCQSHANYGSKQRKLIANQLRINLKTYKNAPDFDPNTNTIANNKYASAMAIGGGFKQLNVNRKSIDPYKVIRRYLQYQPNINIDELEKTGQTTFQKLSGSWYTLAKSPRDMGLELYSGKDENLSHITGFSDINDYLDNEKNITSCWGLGKDGILRIKKTKDKEWKQRLDTLKQQIEYWLQPENTTNKTVEIIQLFYDKN